MNENTLITVCDNCWQASCWKGAFMCEKNKEAGTREFTVRELRDMDKEHESWWTEKESNDH